MDILGQSALLVAVTSFALGSSVFARNVRNKLYIGFAALTTLISGWAFAFFLEKIWPGYGFYRLHLVLNVWLAPAGLAFIRLLVRISTKTSRVLRDSAFVGAIILTAALVLNLDEERRWLLELVYFFPAVVVAQVLHMMWVDRKIRKGAPVGPKTPTVGLASRRYLIYLGALL